MKNKYTLILIVIGFMSFTFNACSENEVEPISIEDEDIETQSERVCGTHNGNTLYTGPQGGCYYYNSNGNKTYVDRSECNC